MPNVHHQQQTIYTRISFKDEELYRIFKDSAERELNVRVTVRKEERDCLVEHSSDLYPCELSDFAHGVEAAWQTLQQGVHHQPYGVNMHVSLEDDVDISPAPITIKDAIDIIHRAACQEQDGDTRPLMSIVNDMLREAGIAGVESAFIYLIAQEFGHDIAELGGGNYVG